jgi:hypothetical protein
MTPSIPTDIVVTIGMPLAANTLGQAARRTVGGFVYQPSADVVEAR